MKFYLFLDIPIINFYFVSKIKRLVFMEQAKCIRNVYNMCNITIYVVCQALVTGCFQLRICQLES